MSWPGCHTWSSPYLYPTWAPLPAFIPQHYPVQLTPCCGTHAARSSSGENCSSGTLLCARHLYHPSHIMQTHISAAPTDSFNTVQIFPNATGNMCLGMPQTTPILSQPGSDCQVRNSTAQENVSDDNCVNSERGMPAVRREGSCFAPESSCGNASQTLCSNIPDTSTGADPMLLRSSGPMPQEGHSKAAEEMTTDLENDTNSVPVSLHRNNFNSQQTCSEAKEACLDKIRTEVAKKMSRINRDLRSLVEMQCDALNATMAHLHVALETTSFTDVHGRLWTSGGSGSAEVSAPVVLVASHSDRAPIVAKPPLSRISEESAFMNSANEGEISSAAMPSNVADTPLSVAKCDDPPSSANDLYWPNISRLTHVCSKPKRVDASTMCGTGLVEESGPSIGENEPCKVDSSLLSMFHELHWPLALPELRWWLVCDRCNPFDQGTTGTMPSFSNTNIAYKWNLSSLGDRSKSIQDIISYFEQNVPMPRVGRAMSHELLTNMSVQEKVSYFENYVPKWQLSRTPEDCQVTGGNHASPSVNTLSKSACKVDDKAAPDVNFEVIRPIGGTCSSTPRRFRAPPSGCGLANLDPWANTVCTSYEGSKTHNEIKQLADLNKQQKKKKSCGRSVSRQAGSSEQLEDVNVRGKKRTKGILKKKRSGGITVSIVVQDRYGAQLEGVNVQGKKQTRGILKKMRGGRSAAIDKRESDDSNRERSRSTCKTRFNLLSETSGHEPMAPRCRSNGKKTAHGKRTTNKGNKINRKKKSTPISKMTDAELNENITKSDAFGYKNYDNIIDPRIAKSRRGRNNGRNDPTKRGAASPIYFDKRLNGGAIGSVCGDCVSVATSQHMSNFLRRYLDSACRCSNGQSCIASFDDKGSPSRYQRAVHQVPRMKRFTHCQLEDTYESNGRQKNDGKDDGRNNSSVSDGGSPRPTGTDAESRSDRWNDDHHSTRTDTECRSDRWNDDHHSILADAECRSGRWNDYGRRSYCCSCSGTGNNYCKFNKAKDTAGRYLSNNSARTCNVGRGNRKIKVRQCDDCGRPSLIHVLEPADDMSCGERLRAFKEARCGCGGYFHVDEAEMDAFLCNGDSC